MRERSLTEEQIATAERLYEEGRKFLNSNPGEVSRLRKENRELKRRLNNLANAAKTKGQRKRERNRKK